MIVVLDSDFKELCKQFGLTDQQIDAMALTLCLPLCHEIMRLFIRQFLLVLRDTKVDREVD